MQPSSVQNRWFSWESHHGKNTGSVGKLTMNLRCCNFGSMNGPWTDGFNELHIQHKKVWEKVLYWSTEVYILPACLQVYVYSQMAMEQWVVDFIKFITCNFLASQPPVVLQLRQTQFFYHEHSLVSDLGFGRIRRIHSFCFLISNSFIDDAKILVWLCRIEL